MDDLNIDLDALHTGDILWVDAVDDSTDTFWSEYRLVDDTLDPQEITDALTAQAEGVDVRFEARVAPGYKGQFDYHQGGGVVMYLEDGEFHLDDYDNTLPGSYWSTDEILGDNTQAVYFPEDDFLPLR